MKGYGYPSNLTKTERNYYDQMTIPYVFMFTVFLYLLVEQKSSSLPVLPNINHTKLFSYAGIVPDSCRIVMSGRQFYEILYVFPNFSFC